MRIRQTLLFTGVYGSLLLGGWLLGEWLTGWVEIDLSQQGRPAMHPMLATVMSIYVLACALPFVPGAEIGLTLIVGLGTRIVGLVYCSTVTALLLAFLVGRFVPSGVVLRAFDTVGLKRAARLVREMQPLDQSERLDFLIRKAPTRFIPFLLSHRYLTLAVLINTPGNTLIGGGGGIALAAGMSGLFSLAGYMITIALAVSPLPLLVLATGYLPGIDG